jgi:molybdate-binding protein/DNA-binding transcriptional regulator YhcF (GntR family)
MSKTALYQQIAETIRQRILQQQLQPGERLPPLRELAATWHCTIGTVQRAYDSLAQQGLVVSRPGQGTHVAGPEPGGGTNPVQQATPLRRASLVHRAEAFLLEVLTAGYDPAEVEPAVRLALDRWRALTVETADRPAQSLRFAGSHDPAVAFITTHFHELAPNYRPHLTFSGSLAGLIALAENQADLAGSHLWDEDSDTYNVSFVRRLLPGRQVALLTLAHRQLGLIVLPENPSQISGLPDLARPEVRFINRQAGAGTRVWLDAQLRRLALSPAQIRGYYDEAKTHTAVALAISEGQAVVGLGLENVALAYGLGFIPLARERYDLVIPVEAWPKEPIQALAQWLTTTTARQEIVNLGGYDVSEMGQVTWLNN